MKIIDLLKGLGIPATYMRFTQKQRPPYAVYYGAGQDKMIADDVPYVRRENYTVEYYFAEKSSAKEAQLEAQLIGEGFAYDKSEDVYISDEKINVIYYTVWRRSNGPE